MLGCTRTLATRLWYGPSQNAFQPLTQRTNACILLCDTDSLKDTRVVTLLHSVYSDMCSKHHGILLPNTKTNLCHRPLRGQRPISQYSKNSIVFTRPSRTIVMSEQWLLIYSIALSCIAIHHVSQWFASKVYVHASHVRHGHNLADGISTITSAPRIVSITANQYAQATERCRPFLQNNVHLQLL